MVEYIIKKNEKKNTYYKVFKDRKKIRINSNEYLKNNKQRAGSIVNSNISNVKILPNDRCINLLGKLYKNSLILSKLLSNKTCYNDGKKIEINGLECCIDKTIFNDIELKEKIINVLNNKYNYSSVIVKEKAIIDDPNCKLYIVGDMEGNVFLLYQWFLNMGFIDKELNWLDNNIYVVQCGDQLDAKRFTKSKTSDNDIDLGVLLFMDYMNYISNNRVLSIIGNHEWMNIYSDFRYVKDNDKVNIDRSFFFKYDQLFGKIMRRRNFVIRVNNCIISHAGVSYKNIEDYKNIITHLKLKFTIDDFIKDINNEVDNPNNYIFTSKKSNIYDNVINSVDGILWHRYYRRLIVNSSGVEITTDLHEVDMKIPDELKNYIIIKGHDKGNSLWICYNNKSIKNPDKKKCVTKIDNMYINNVSVITTDTIYLYHNYFTFAEIVYIEKNIKEINKFNFDFRETPLVYTNLWRNILNIYDSRISNRLNELIKLLKVNDKENKLPIVNKEIPEFYKTLKNKNNNLMSLKRGRTLNNTIFPMNNN